VTLSDEVHVNETGPRLESGWACRWFVPKAG
jgi:uncharacterized protein YodC (DUF2158 family)